MVKRISVPISEKIDTDLAEIQKRYGMSEAEAAQYAIAAGLTKTELQKQGRIVYKPEDGSPNIVLGDEDGSYILDKYRRRI